MMIGWLVKKIHVQSSYVRKLHALQGSRDISCLCSELNTMEQEQIDGQM